MFFIAAHLICTIILDLAKGLQRNRKKQLGGKPRRTIFRMGTRLPYVVNRFDYVATIFTTTTAEEVGKELGWTVLCAKRKSILTMQKVLKRGCTVGCISTCVQVNAYGIITTPTEILTKPPKRRVGSGDENKH